MDFVGKKGMNENIFTLHKLEDADEFACQLLITIQLQRPIQRKCDGPVINFIEFNGGGLILFFLNCT